VIALGVYAILVLAIFKLISVTLTLAGIAGFILSVGMAVDANVLIFERMKEEKKSGRDRISSINEGFKRAWPSIRDGNVSTLITAIILYWFGTSIIKGFALTLFIGILISMFTAIVLTRHLLKLGHVHH
jgi:preprotein translocase subunit SecD